MLPIRMDGVFSVAGPTPAFFQLRGPTDEELADIVEAAANIVIETLRKDGYLTDEGVETDRPDWGGQGLRRLGTVVGCRGGKRRDADRLRRPRRAKGKAHRSRFWLVKKSYR